MRTSVFYFGIFLTLMIGHHVQYAGGGNTEDHISRIGGMNVPWGDVSQERDLSKRSRFTTAPEKQTTTKVGTIISAVSYVCCIGHLCQDIDNAGCVAMASQNANMCSDPVLRQTACPRFCNSCPITCYNCSIQTPDVTSCNTITCGNDQACMVKEVKSMTGRKHSYTLSCENIAMCNGNRKRSLMSRSVYIDCCQTELCNQPRLTTTAITTKILPTTTLPTTNAMSTATTPCTPAQIVDIVTKGVWVINGMVILQCVTKGNPKPNVDWSKRSDDTSPGVYYNSSSLLLGPITSTHAEYRCDASNACGSVNRIYTAKPQAPNIVG